MSLKTGSVGFTGVLAIIALLLWSHLNGPEEPDVEWEVEVFRSSSCSCCLEYESYLTENGYRVTAQTVESAGERLAAFGVPMELASCHTSIVGDYVIEGHVPVAVIERLLREEPDIRGIALPGMPAGSPGMGGQPAAPFQIFELTDGEPRLFEIVD